MNFGRGSYNYILDAELRIVRLKVWNSDGSMNLKNMLRWGKWREESADRLLAKTQVGPFRVSTVFLGIDCRSGKGPPILFETMVFDENNPRQFKFSRIDRTYFPEVGSLTKRYCTYEQAEEGHRETVAKLRSMMRRAQRRQKIAGQALKAAKKARKL